ncbi:MAG: glucose-1-phosphate thymidylyltransferase [Candidatus Magasanikbacteria bacterium RIFCSPHIGHO2_02_FULL_50_9b]|uniref:Glucose-1-phosphate thymidylyltransferase n=2 Tax=Candidatus Magasanikiibacteriota TaxID=1752731 RepID=A0A1F6M7L2_9BACT|nr:MAG: glucose-1-phosphate thymidylyltransferase [Candidatus Magasanikbacteria bacterium RIFCSPHIGHO2_02_FULL_50_9b]
MKALIAAGGNARRLRPITYTINKHLIPLANKPMIFFAIEHIVEAGIQEIFININPGEKELQQYVGDGGRWGARITYVEQTGGPKGVAHIIKNAEHFMRGEPFLFHLGDNIVLGDLRRFAQRFAEENLDALFAFARVPDPQRFGVPVIEHGKLVRIEEKPAVPKTDLAQTGIYFYNDTVFEAVNSIEPSSRGEYEISDANTFLIQAGRRVGWEEITGWWKDTGKPEDLLEGNQLLLNEVLSKEAINNGMIGPNVKIQGRVQIGKNTKVWDNVLIRGPVSIGENAMIKNSYIGPYTSIGNNCVIDNTEIEHSVIMDYAEVRAGTRIVDSIIGKNAIIESSKNSLPLGHKLVIGDNSQVEV